MPCNASDPSQQGWTYDATHNAIVALDGRCVSYGLDGAGTLLTLQECDGRNSSSSAQFLQYEKATGHFANMDRPAPWPYHSNGMCLTLFGWQLPSCGSTPSAKMYPCLGDQTDQRWQINGTTISDGCGLCLAARSVPQAPDTSVQLWVKPQPSGAVAALVINNSPAPATVSIDFARDLGMQAAAQVRVRDIWERADMGVFASSFTGHVPPFDSGFHLFTPLHAN